jgi:hypothetical protein
MALSNALLAITESLKSETSFAVKRAGTLVSIKQWEFGPLANVTDYVSKDWPTSRNPTNPDKKAARLWRLTNVRQDTYIIPHPLIANRVLLLPIIETNPRIKQSHYIKLFSGGRNRTCESSKVHVASWSVSLDTAINTTLHAFALYCTPTTPRPPGSGPYHLDLFTHMLPRLAVDGQFRIVSIPTSTAPPTALIALRLLPDLYHEPSDNRAPL